MIELETYLEEKDEQIKKLQSKIHVLEIEHGFEKEKLLNLMKEKDDLFKEAQEKWLNTENALKRKIMMMQDFNKEYASCQQEAHTYEFLKFVNSNVLFLITC